MAFSRVNIPGPGILMTTFTGRKSRVKRSRAPGSGFAKTRTFHFKKSAQREDGNLVHALCPRDTARRLNFLRFAWFRSSGCRSFQIANAPFLRGLAKATTNLNPNPVKAQFRTTSSQLLNLVLVSMVAHLVQCFLLQPFLAVDLAAGRTSLCLRG